jgi:hypothetical protein
MELDPVTSVLVRKLDRELRRHVLERRDAMLRELRFLRLREDSFLRIAQSAGWTEQRLEVLCGLNSFYQLVLGPLTSSARERFGILGREVPILYGDSLRFDAKRATKLRAAHRAFFTAIADVPNANNIMTAPHFSDLLFRLASNLGQDGRG